MKPLALIILLLLAVSMRAEPDPAALKLIRHIPSQAAIDHFREQAKSGSSESESQKAKDALLAAIKDFRTLQPLIKIGSSIFDYPGLLALPTVGLLSYDAEKHLYKIPIGAYALIPEGSDQWIFKVCFDDKGIIRRIEPVLLSF